MESEFFGFNVSEVLVGILRLMKQKGILEETGDPGHSLGGQGGTVSMDQRRH